MNSYSKDIVSKFFFLLEHITKYSTRNIVSNIEHDRFVHGTVVVRYITFRI